MKTYRNGKAIQARASDGSFREWTGDDVGIGVCPKCSYLTVTPPEPASFKSGMIAPEDYYRRWNKARVCDHCGWKNPEAEAMLPQDRGDGESIMNPTSLSLPETARDLAVRSHGPQLYGDKPYVIHLEQVVAVLRRFNLATPELESAAWLHDVIEDTSTSEVEIARAGFPTSVIAIVLAVTDEPGANRQERKAKTYPKIAALRDAVAVKLADRIANVEAGGKLDLYSKEYPQFRSALYNPVHNLSAMWDYLDAKLTR